MHAAGNKPDGSPIFVDQQKTNATGWFRSSFTIPRIAAAGMYTVTVTCEATKQIQHLR